MSCFAILNKAGKSLYGSDHKQTFAAHGLPLSES